MSELKKEFVPYQEALELKELGFDKPCIWGYSTNTQQLETYSSFLATRDSFTVDAPTYSQAFRWFREKYLLHHEITCGSNVFWFRYGHNSHVGVLSTDTNNDNYYATYEEAELACLKKLIKITKNK